MGYNPAMTPEEILAAIQQLDAADRRQLDALLVADKDDGRNLTRPQQYVADAIQEICRIRPPLAQLRKLGISARTNDLFDWLGDQTTGLTETQVYGLVLICIKAIARDLDRRQRPHDDPAALLDGIHHVGLAMDHSFPGYWASNLLYRLVPKAEIVAA
jgi:hypothetical protein